MGDKLEEEELFEKIKKYIEDIEPLKEIYEQKSLEELFKILLNDLHRYIQEGLVTLEMMGVDGLSLIGISYHFQRVAIEKSMPYRIPESKQEILERLLNFYTEIEKEIVIPVFLVFEGGKTGKYLINFINFLEKEKLFEIEIPWKIKIEGVYIHAFDERTKKMAEAVKEELRKFGIDSFFQWESFEKKLMSESQPLLIYGLEFPIPDLETMFKRWLRLLKNGISIYTEFTLDFLNERDWEELVNAIKEKPIVFSAGPFKIGPYAKEREIKTLKEILRTLNQKYN